MAHSKKNLEVDGLVIRVREDNDYICLTDIARKVDPRTDIVLSNWLRNGDTMDFMYEWEMMYNSENFNTIIYDGFRKQAGKIGNVMTSKKWVEGTGAIGIESKAGRYGGTYAHRDIAYEFCAAVSASFKLSLIQGFDMLVKEKYKRLGEPYEITRLMTKGTFPLLSEGIREQIPANIRGTKKEGIYFASEVDMINQILFGSSAEQWRKEHPKAKPGENMRDYASARELLILSALQALNERLLKWGCDKEQRFDLLTEATSDWRAILTKKKSIQDLTDRIDRQKKLKR
ncbi:MAG: hypothetical protein ACI9VN_003234 [Patescibacteria group bacterium]|jgi:hypothetical protein